MTMAFLCYNRDSDYPWTYRCIQDTKDGPACQREETESNSTEKVCIEMNILTKYVLMSVP